MDVPILKQGRTLIATVQAALSDAELLRLRDNLLERARAHRSTGVILDVTALDVMDSFACRSLRTMSQSLKLEGAQTVIVGIQPDVAFAMVQLGLSLEGMAAALDLEEGLALLERMSSKPACYDG